jgi:hypothetical protein
VRAPLIATLQAPLKAGAQRTLEVVACKRLFGAAQVSDSDPAGSPYWLGFPEPLSKSTPTPWAWDANPNAVRPLP